MTNKKKTHIYSRLYALVAAYTYEVLNTPIISDELYDQVVAPAAEETNGKQLGFYDEIDFDKSTGMWVPKEDKKLDALSRLVIEATRSEYNKNDMICHYPEFCELVKQVYEIDLFW